MSLCKFNIGRGQAALLLLLGLVNLSHVSGNGGWQSSSPESEQDQGERAFRVVTGPIEDSNEDDETDFMPWRHHVDFDELHPGEDQIAMETVREPRRMREPPRREIESFEPQQPLFDDDDLVVPDFSRMFAEGPQIGGGLPASGVDLHPWLNVRGLRRLVTKDPWWTGSNVCMKREEEEETVDKDNSDEENSGSSSNTSMTTMGQPEFHMQFSACEDLDTRHSCITRLYGPKVTKTIKTEYECCHGYALNEQKDKCERGRYENIAKTIEEIGGREFMRLVRSVRLYSKLERDNLTVFVPSDDALASFLQSNPVETNSIEFIPGVEPARRRRSILMHRKNEPGGRNVRRRNHPDEHRDEGQQEYPMSVEEQVFEIDDFDWKRNALTQHDEWTRNHVTYDHDGDNAELQQTLLSHMIEGSLSTDDFVDEKVVYSENKDSVIRLNTWNVGQERVKTVNCARLISVNHKCTNGMVHLVDKMFKPVTKTIADIIASNPELSMLKTLLSSSGLMTMLRKSEEHLTMFAPTNSALDKIGHSLLFKMRSGDPCLKRILRHHILPITFCSSIVYNEGQVKNIDFELLDVKRNADDKLFINGSQIITRDIVTTNGVVHIIDAVIMSENDRPASQALEKSGLTTFLNYMERAGLKSSLDEMTNVTIFAPSNEALASLPQEVVQDVAKLREVMLFHVATPETRACHFSHQQKLRTKLQDQSISIHLFSSFPFGTDAQVTAQCGLVTKTNNVACNGIIHEIDQVLLPPQLHLIETLKTQPDFSIFNRIIQDSNLIESLRNSDNTFTVFAPTDAAFYSLPKEQFQRILNDTREQERLLKRHITKESLCCAGIVPNVFFMTKAVVTLGGSHIPVYRDANGQVLFGNAKVTTCDLTASNAIIHTVNSVLVSDNRSIRGEQMGACLPETLDKMDIRSLFFRI